jgi:hypothetical protein
MKQSINCDDPKNKDNSECQIADAFFAPFAWFGMIVGITILIWIITIFFIIFLSKKYPNKTTLIIIISIVFAIAIPITIAKLTIPK